jgi:hypothetical protein
VVKILLDEAKLPPYIMTMPMPTYDMDFKDIQNIKTIKVILNTKDFREIQLVRKGITVGEFFRDVFDEENNVDPDPDHYMIRVNRRPIPETYKLQDGDLVTIIPNKAGSMPKKLKGTWVGPNTNERVRLTNKMQPKGSLEVLKSKLEEMTKNDDLPF